MDDIQRNVRNSPDFLTWIDDILVIYTVWHFIQMRKKKTCRSEACNGKTTLVKYYRYQEICKKIGKMISYRTLSPEINWSLVILHMICIDDNLLHLQTDLKNKHSGSINLPLIHN